MVLDLLITDMEMWLCKEIIYQKTMSIFCPKIIFEETLKIYFNILKNLNSFKIFLVKIAKISLANQNKNRYVQYIKNSKLNYIF